MRAIDADDRQAGALQGAHSDWVLDTVFSKDGTHLISVSRDMSMKLIEVATQRFIDNITSITPGALKGGLDAVDRHPTKDELLIGGADGVPKIYQDAAHQGPRDRRRLQPDQSLRRRAGPHLRRRTSTPTAAASPSAAASTAPARCACTKPTAASCCTSWKARQGAVYAVAFSTDGKLVASAGFDGMVRLNDADTGKLIKEFVARADRARDKVATQR